MKPKLKREQTAHEERLEKVARFYLHGETQAEIAERYKISQQQVIFDLQFIRERWRESSIEKIEEKTAIELAKIDAAETPSIDYLIHIHVLEFYFVKLNPSRRNS